MYGDLMSWFLSSTLCALVSMVIPAGAQICEPTFLGERGIHAHSSAMYGDHMYIANGRFGLMIVDVQNQGNPIVIREIAGPEIAQSICIEGQTLYLGGQNPELVLYDLSDPLNPKELASYDASFGEGRDIEFADGHVYLTGGNSTQIFSVEDRTDPVRVGSVSGEGIWKDAAVDGDKLYVAAGLAGGVRSYSIADRSSPVLLDKYATFRAPNGIEIKDSNLYVVSELDGALRIFSAVDPENLALLHSVDFGIDSADGNRIAIAGDLALMTTLHTSNVIAVDITIPAQAFLLDVFESRGFTHDIRAEDDHVVVTKLHSGIEMIDIRNPDELELLSYLGFSGLGREFVEYGGELFFLNSYGAGSIRPTAEAPYFEYGEQIILPSGVSDLAVVDHLLLAAGNRDVWLVDLSTDQREVIGHYWAEKVRISDIAAHGQFLYIVRGQDSIEAIDISDPAEPVLHREIQLPEIGDADQIIASDGLLYVNSMNDAISIIYPGNEIGDVMLEQLDVQCASNCAMTVHEQGILYAAPVALFSSGEWITQINAIDVRDPIRPVILPHVETLVNSNRIYSSGTYLASVNTGQPGGLELLDVSDFHAPLQIGYAEISDDYVRDVLILGERLYVTCGAPSGIVPTVLKVFDLHSCDEPMCDVDISGDGVLDKFDVFAYLDLFNASDPAADLTGDGSYDIFDVFAYLDAYSAGCP
jgi:hypothetical protein